MYLACIICSNNNNYYFVKRHIQCSSQRFTVSEYTCTMYIKNKYINQIITHLNKKGIIEKIHINN